MHIKDKTTGRYVHAKTGQIVPEFRVPGVSRKELKKLIKQQDRHNRAIELRNERAGMVNKLKSIVDTLQIATDKCDEHKKIVEKLKASFAKRPVKTEAALQKRADELAEATKNLEFHNSMLLQLVGRYNNLYTGLLEFDKQYGFDSSDFTKAPSEQYDVIDRATIVGVSDESEASENTNASDGE